MEQLSIAVTFLDSCPQGDLPRLLQCPQTLLFLVQQALLALLEIKVMDG